MGGTLSSTRDALSWGRYPQQPQRIHPLWTRHSPLPVLGAKLLPRGNGRSYGDVCLNSEGVLLHTRGLDHFISFDWERGVLTCEAGVTLAEILTMIVPRGWFLPVTPGTKFVTLGGAIANDVHGKNHHRSGSFGHFVRRLELLRSDETRIICSRDDHSDWFAATIGGLGLTGLITWAEIQLRPIWNEWLAAETLRYRSIDEFFELSAESARDYEYTVAWIDSTSRKRPGSGIFFRANHAPFALHPLQFKRSLSTSIPFTPPFSAINRFSVGLLNSAYFQRSKPAASPKLVHYEPFFYPLDAIKNWNRLYGPQGFLQYQCVLPSPSAREGLREILQRIRISGEGSFVSVLKVFGDAPKTGLLSFPRPGVTLALDFPISGPSTFTLLDDLDSVVMTAGGTGYPAKDARMKACIFRGGFADLDQFKRFVDPSFSSTFWKRMGY